jgi:hypothetical protein
MSAPRLTCKELAERLRRHVTFVYAMKKIGFDMPGGTATLDAALHFLRRHPKPRARRKAA